MRFFTKFKYLIAFLIAVGFGFSAFNGCDDSGNVNVDPVDTNVAHYDSIWVQELESAGSFNGINLLAGEHCNGSYNLRDASLGGGNDTTGLGINFFLRTGILDQFADAGYITKWFQVKANSTQIDFDTLTIIQDNIGSALDTLDFTQETTEFWGYFNFPLTEFPIYCFWLQGKRDGGLTNGKNVYGIIRPKISFDTNPSGVFGYSIVFEVKINKNGDNYFFHGH